MAPRRPEALTGREIAGQFRLEEYLGRGRTTLVFRALDLTTGDEVAIKLLASSLSSDVGFMRRFRHVMRAASTMDHPNVLRVLAWGEERELFVVTELMAGPLRSLMGTGSSQNARLTAGQTATMAVDASRGLAYLAQRNQVHRRLHPSNLLVSVDGRVVVADAGLAWILAHESGHQFSDFRYLAPEAGSGTTGPATDVYALGMIMAEAITGDLPMLAGDVNATLGLRHGTNVVLDESWGRIRSAIGAAGRADAQARVPADRLDVGLMALIDRLEGQEVALGRIDPALRSDELEAMRLTIRDRLPEVAAQATATLAAPTGGSAASARGSLSAPVSPPQPSSPAPSKPASGATAPAKPAGSIAGSSTEDSAAPASAAEAKSADDGAVVPTEAPISTETTATPDSPRQARGRRRATPVPRQADEVDEEPDPNAPTPEELATRRNWTVGSLVMAIIVLLVFLGVQRFVASPAATVPDLIGASMEEARAEATVGRWRLNTSEVRRDDTDPDEILVQEPAPGTELEAGESVDITVSLGPTLVELPDLVDMSEEEAEQVIVFAEMKLGSVDREYNADIKPGTVMAVDADFVTGDQLPKGSAVNLSVSDGAKPRQIPADLVGENALTVVASLEELKVKPVIERVQDPSVPLNYVVSLDPPEGAKVTIGDEVKVRVSSPRDKVEVPDVVGKSASQADAELRGLGLTVLGIEGPAGGTVQRTDPKVGTEVPQGTSVRLVTG